MRDVNSDGLVVLVKLSEQKNEECSADGPGRSLRMLAGQFVPFNSESPFFLVKRLGGGEGGCWIMSPSGSAVRVTVWGTNVTIDGVNG